MGTAPHTLITISRTVIKAKNSIYASNTGS